MMPRDRVVCSFVTPALLQIGPDDVDQLLGTLGTFGLLVMDGLAIWVST